MDDLAIGIDLGTTNCCVSLYRNGKTTVLENVDGGRITPSFIFFGDLEEIIVGEHGEMMASDKPDCGISGIKRLVGRNFDDSVQSNFAYLPFRIEKDNSNKPLVVIEQENRTLKKTPQELCAIILEKLKKDVETKLGQAVTKAVITVPAYFDVAQREVTLAAAKDAGFTVLKLLNESTAAALFSYFEKDADETNYSLVYDLGGGTFDVAILKRNLNQIEIVAVDGDTQLGGQDLDNLIADYVAEELIRDYKYDPKVDKENLRRFRKKCEAAKKALSTVSQTVIILIGFVNDYPRIKVTLTRQQFEEIGDKLFLKSLAVVDNCIKNSKISKNDINEVILSGGSTRIPKIQNMISDYFGGKALNKFVNPDECVAEGAALQAAMLSKSPKQSIQKVALIDVIPLSLGVGTLVDHMSFVIRKNSPIPTSGNAIYYTAKDRQPAVMIEIFEGERTNVRKNRFVGSMIISDLTPAPPGQCKIVFTLRVDDNGILTATATETLCDNVKELKVNYVRGDKPEHDIKNKLLDAETHKEEDARFTRFANFKTYLFKYCIGVTYNLKNKNLTGTCKEISKLCRETQKAGRSTKVEEEERVKALIKKLRLQCEPVVKYYKFDLMPADIKLD